MAGANAKNGTVANRWVLPESAAPKNGTADGTTVPDVTGVPVEVPWQLLATTGAHRRDAEDPDFAASYSPALSISTFLVPSALTEGAYPGRRVVYFKFTVTVTPGRLHDAEPPSRTAGDGTEAEKLAKQMLEWCDPARALLLDVALAPVGNRIGEPTPTDAYFIAAAPMSRDFAQSFTVTTDSESASDSQVRTGSSTTQTSEKVDSTITTTEETDAWGVGGVLGIFGGGGGSSDTTTTVTIDGKTTSSTAETSNEKLEANRKRRNEGFSSQITNLLALLRARFVSTPNLQFAVRPRPVTRAPRDVSDPEGWYTAHLEQLSAGLDGVQEFFGVAVVNGEASRLEVKARMRVAYVATNAAPPQVFPKIDPLAHVADLIDTDDQSENPAGVVLRRYQDEVKRLELYLNLVYPPGTLAESLDLDVASSVETIRRHVPPAWVPALLSIPNIRTVTGKPMGPTPIIVSGWRLPVVFRSESTYLKAATSGGVFAEVKWRELYAAFRVEWTELVPFPPMRDENLVAGERIALQPKYIGRMTPVVRTAVLPYKPLSAIVQDLNRSAVGFTGQLHSEMQASRRAWATSGTLTASVELLQSEAAAHAGPDRVTNVPGVNRRSAWIDSHRPLIAGLETNARNAARLHERYDAELVRALAVCDFAVAITPQSVVDVVVDRLEALEGVVRPALLDDLEKWAGVRLDHRRSPARAGEESDVQSQFRDSALPAPGKADDAWRRGSAGGTWYSRRSLPDQGAPSLGRERNAHERMLPDGPAARVAAPDPSSGTASLAMAGQALVRRTSATPQSLRPTIRFLPEGLMGKGNA